MNRVKFSQEMSKIEHVDGRVTKNDSISPSIIQDQGFKLKFDNRKHYDSNEHIDILAMPKPEY